jgi:hypothetical protein
MMQEIRKKILKPQREERAEVQREEWRRGRVRQKMGEKWDPVFKGSDPTSSWKRQAGRRLRGRASSQPNFKASQRAIAGCIPTRTNGHDRCLVS